MKTLATASEVMTSAAPVRRGRLRNWQRWTPYAAVTWSLAYAALGVYWAVSRRGFPYSAKAVSDLMQPLLERLGPDLAWVVVILAGLPAAVVGAAMLREAQSRALRPLLIAAGTLLTFSLLVLMTGLNLLVLFGYIPYTVLSLFSGAEIGQKMLESWTQWSTIHQLLCLMGGFLWLGATVCYSRRCASACLYCGRSDSPKRWQKPEHAARWGRMAVYLAMVAPIFYAFTRYAWALGFPLGISQEHLHRGQESGTWISGLFLANFALLGAILMLGLVQRWGEVFPGWMIGLAGRRVPLALAIVPALFVSVPLIVGGVGIWSAIPQMARSLEAAGVEKTAIIGEIIFVVGPTLLFPVWGLALVVATFGYYYRRRSPCNVCGRGA